MGLGKPNGGKPRILPKPRRDRSGRFNVGLGKPPLEGKLKRSGKRKGSIVADDDDVEMGDGDEVEADADGEEV